MSESLSQSIIRMAQRMESLRTRQTADAMNKMHEGYSLIAYVVQIGGAGAYLGKKGTPESPSLGGVFGIENAERFDHRSALHASMNLREADGTKSNSGSVVLFTKALEDTISGVSSLIQSMQAHLDAVGDNPDFL